MTEATQDKEPSKLGWAWHAGFWAVIVVAVVFLIVISRFESHEAGYVDAGHERASHVMDRRMERAKTSEEPIVRLQSWAYINSLQKCMLGKSGIFQTSRVDIRMMALAKGQPLSGVDQKLVGEAVESVEKECNGSLLREVAMTNPVAALALAAELGDQGLILPPEVLDGAEKNRLALSQMSPLDLVGN